MEEKILKILEDVNEEILTFTGDNLFEAGLLNSFLVIDLVSEIEDEFDIEIDAQYIREENFKTKDDIIDLVKKLL